jgi:hypothetical protein
MKNIFDLKKGHHKFYDKPQKFYTIYTSGNAVSFEQQETYGVFYTSKMIEHKRTNVFWFQPKRLKGTRKLSFYRLATDVCMNIEEAKTLAKQKRIQTAEERLANGEKKVKLNQTYLNNYSNFEPELDQDEYYKTRKMIRFTFPKLKEIRQSIFS